MPEAKNNPAMMQVSLNIDNISVLIGLTYSYSKQYLANLQAQLKKADVETAKDINNQIMRFVQASGVLSRALSDMLTEGEQRELNGDRNPFPVLFTEFEHLHILNMLQTSNLDKALSLNVSKEAINNTLKLIEDTKVRFESAKRITPEEYAEVKKANQVVKDIKYDVPFGFFPQYKVGSA